jgi:hypothetical protein
MKRLTRRGTRLRSGTTPTTLNPARAGLAAAPSEGRGGDNRRRQMYQALRPRDREPPPPPAYWRCPRPGSLHPHRLHVVMADKPPLVRPLRRSRNQTPIVREIGLFRRIATVEIVGRCADDAPVLRKNPDRSCRPGRRASNGSRDRILLRPGSACALRPPAPARSRDGACGTPAAAEKSAAARPQLAR